MSSTSLVTGGSGFVACHLVQQLLEADLLAPGDDQPRHDPGALADPGFESGSLFLLDEMLKGGFFYGMPDLNLTTGDVCEVAQAPGPFFGHTRDCIGTYLGIRFAVDKHRSAVELGIVYRPVRETLFDHYRSWVA